MASQVAAPGPFQQAVHFEKVENARKLNDSEFSYNAQLGFVSLNMPLNNDEVLAVSYEYTYKGETYQVGEFSTDGIAGQDALMLKLLKPTITNPKMCLDIDDEERLFNWCIPSGSTRFPFGYSLQQSRNIRNVPFFPDERQWMMNKLLRS